jgi:hypothetical protein
MLVVLLAGIAALGFAAFKRGQAPVQTAAAPPVDPAPADVGAGQPDPQQSSAAVPEPPPAGTLPESKPAETPASPPPAPAAPAPVSTSSPSSSAPAGAKPDAATKKAKPPAPKPTEVVTPPPPVTAESATPPATPPAPPAPEVAPVTFKDVKVLVAQGDSMREGDAVLTLAADHLVVHDRSGKAEILSLPYRSIVQAFYSRSKQPKWKGADGKEAEAEVDLGKLSFFRGDRNWLILTTQAEPVFIRLENSNLQAALAAVQERSGVTVQR